MYTNLGGRRSRVVFQVRGGPPHEFIRIDLYKKMLGRKNRITRNKDFKKIFKKGRLIKGGLVDLRVAVTGFGFSRFGFLVGLKVSKKATLRNRTKRLLRETARSFLREIKPGYDVLIIAKEKIINKNQIEITGDLKNVIQKAGLNIN